MTAAEQIGDGETLTVLEAPFTSAAEVALLSYPLIPVSLLTKDQFRSDTRIGAITVPTLVLDRRSRIRLVWGFSCQAVLVNFSCSHSLVRPRRRHSSAPAMNFLGRRAQAPSRSVGAPTSTYTVRWPGRTLTVASTAACCRGWAAFGVRRCTNQACIRFYPFGCNHEAVFRFCGRAPRRRGHSLNGIAAIAGFGLPSPRTVVDRLAPRRRNRDRTLSRAFKSLLNGPAATPRLPALLLS